MHARKLVFVITASIAIAACSNKRNGEATKDEPTPSPPAAAAPPAPAPAANAAPVPPGTVSAAAAHAPPGDVLEVKIESVGETMTFNVTTMNVSPGQTVHLTLKNNAKSPLMPHNWVLVKPGSEASVALRGVELKDKGYLASGDADVLAATTLAGPGTTVELTFTAPDVAGTYPYICTVPGHYMMMKGKMIVAAGGVGSSRGS